MPVNSPTPTLDTAATTTHGGELSRSLGVGGNVLITLSSISPASSVFILGGSALARYGTGVFWAFLIAGVVSILIAFCYAELASAYPVAGGDYSLVSRALGPAFGVATFFISLVSLPLIVAVFAPRRRRLPRRRDPRAVAAATALVVVVLTTVTACFDIRTNAWLTGVFLVVEMAALALLTVLGFVHMERPLTDLLEPGGPRSARPATSHRWRSPDCVLAVTQGIFAYNGYGGAVYFAEETKNAARSIAKAVHLERGHHRRHRTRPAHRDPGRAPARRPNSSAPPAGRVIPHRTRRSRRRHGGPALDRPRRSSTRSSRSRCRRAGCSTPQPATAPSPSASPRRCSPASQGPRARRSPPS